MRLSSALCCCFTVAFAALGFAACSGSGDGGALNNSSVSTDSITSASQDLKLYELKGPVKECTKTSYFDVTMQGDRFVVDSAGTNVVKSTAHFDSNGNYVAKSHERVTRDKQGRLTRWEDRRPNVDNIHGGVLKDTLQYSYINGNHVLSDGMGVYALVVFDDDNKVVGQYTVPSSTRKATSAFNVYKAFDDRGNWTERVTIWSTEGMNDPHPSVHYSIDRRDIVYY